MRKIISEVCLGITFLLYLCGAPAKEAQAEAPSSYSISSDIVMVPVVPINTVSTNKEVYLKQKYEELIDIQQLLLIDPVLYTERFKEINKKYSEWIEPSITVYDAYTEDEINLLGRCIETETNGAGFINKVHIANVIFNRVKAEGRFGNDIIEVIKAPGQFAYSKKTASPLTIAAIEYAFMTEDTTQGALYFHSGSQTNKFNGANYLFTDSVGHHFYK